MKIARSAPLVFVFLFAVISCGHRETAAPQYDADRAQLPVPILSADLSAPACAHVRAISRWEDQILRALRSMQQSISHPRRQTLDAGDGGDSLCAGAVR